MPITQPRMIALINAAADFQQAAESIIGAITDESRNVKAGRLTAEEALYNLNLLSLRLTLKNPERSFTTLAIESDHFRKNHRRNTRATERKAERRAGLPGRQQSHDPAHDPDSLFLTPEDQYETEPAATIRIVEAPQGYDPQSMGIYAKLGRNLARSPAITTQPRPKSVVGVEDLEPQRQAEPQYEEPSAENPAGPDDDDFLSSLTDGTLTGGQEE